MIEYTNTVTVVITDLMTGEVTSVAELPEHLNHWTYDAIAEWAVERDDNTFGRSVDIDHNSEVDYFGANEWSFTMYYRAGGRYQVALTVVTNGPVYSVTFPDGDVREFRTEDMAVSMAGSIDGSVLGVGTMVL